MSNFCLNFKYINKKEQKKRTKKKEQKNHGRSVILT